MATERQPMRHTREILCQKWLVGHTPRVMAPSLDISAGGVGSTGLRARAAGLSWPELETLTDDALERRLYSPPSVSVGGSPVPHCAYLHAERKKPGVTLELLHLGYLEPHPTG